MKVSWTERAACVGLWDLFDLPEGKHVRPGQVAAARNVCADCPVFEQCDDYQRSHAVEGIWAGVVRKIGVRPRNETAQWRYGHGDPRRYWNGCRCVDCTRANADYKRALAARRRAEQ